MFCWLQDVTTWDMDSGLQGGTASQIIIPITELERSEMRTGGNWWSGLSALDVKLVSWSARAAQVNISPGSLAPSSGSLASSYVVTIDITTTTSPSPEQVSS